MIDREIERDERGLAALVKEHEASLTDDVILPVLSRTHGAALLKDNKLYQEKAAEYRKNKTAEFHEHLSVIKQRFQNAATEMETKIAKNTIKATNGDYIVDRYAKQMKLSEEAAKAELDEYTTRKTTAFKPDSLADQYASLKHLPNLKELDRDFATSTLEREINSAIPSDLSKQAKLYKFYANLSPEMLHNEFRGNAWAGRQAFRGKFD